MFEGHVLLTDSAALIHSFTENVFICIREVIDSWHGYHMDSGGDSSTEITQQVLWSKQLPIFHHHASEDICIAALPKGMLTQQDRLPQHQHNESACECVRARANAREHTLSFLSQEARVGVKHWRTFSDEDPDKKVQFQRVALRESSKGNIHRLQSRLDGVQLQISKPFSAKWWSTERMITFLYRLVFTHSAVPGGSSQSVTALI